jgi:hypothetical protein
VLANSSGGAPTLPVANPVSASVVLGKSVLINVIAADTGTGITLTGVDTPQYGTAVISNGQILYTAPLSYAGPDSLGYTITDSFGDSVSGTVSVTVDLAAAATNLQPTVFSPALNVAENAGATNIGIALPTDPMAASTALAVVITGVPADGSVTTSDGRGLAVGQSITAAQLTGLLFTPTPGLFGTNSTLQYSVTDPAGNAGTGAALLAIGPALGNPAVSQPKLTLAPAAAATAIGIAAPSDPNYAASALTITVQQLPYVGSVTLADGVTPIAVGEVLSAAQLAGLLITPLPGLVAGSDALIYSVADPSGNHSTGLALITVGPVSAPPSIGFVPPAGGAPVALAITDEAQPAFAGLAQPGASITISGVAASTTAGIGGAFSVSPSVGTAPVRGQTITVSATAALPGLPVSTASAPVSVMMLPTADANGIVTTDLSSLDVAQALNAGYSLQLTPGTEAIDLVDGVLSVGPDTNEAFIQRLYVGLLGRTSDAAGMEFWDLQMALGATKVQIAQGFLNSAEYQARPQAANTAAFITQLDQGFTGQSQNITGLDPTQSQAQLAASIDDSAASKTANAAATALVFARSQVGTVIHDIYEAGLNREVELGGLNFWKALSPALTVAQIAALIDAQPEPIFDHAGQTDTQFVTQIYQEGTGQPPTAAQLSSALASIQGGATRADILLQVASSQASINYLTSNNFAQPPSLTPLPTLTVPTGRSVTTQISGADPNGGAITYGLASGPTGASVNPTTGVFSYAGSPVPLTGIVTVSATDAAGLVSQARFALNVTLAGPVLSATAPASAIEGSETFLSLSASSSVAATAVTGWSVNWGDGSAAETITAASATPGHVYTSQGHYTVIATALTTSAGSFAAAPVAISVAPDTLEITSLTAENTGFHVRFNGVLDPTTLSLLSNSSGAAPSIIVTGAFGVIAGSFVLDPDGAGFRFIAAAGALADGTYKVVIRGTVADQRGRALDGSGDGVPGYDFSASFSVLNDTDALSMTGFMVGPGQTASVPGDASGLPVAFTSDGTAKSVVFTVTYNPALLTVTGASAASGLPAGTIVGVTQTTLANGFVQATITVTAPTAIAAGTATLVDLQASVPAGAAYGSTDVLALAIVSVNGVAQALPASSGLQVVGYLGDADGNGVLNASDSAAILRVVGGAASGFAAWSGVAPRVIGDLDGDGAVTTADALLVGTTAPAVPGNVTLTLASATPFVSAPASLTADVGGTVTVPVNLSSSVALSSGTITLRYNAQALTLTAVRADPGSGLTVTANPSTPGIVTATLSGTGAATTGVLALFDFQVASTVAPGTNLPLDLSAVTLDGQALDSMPGADGTDGRVLIEPAGTVLVSMDIPILSDTSSTTTNTTRTAQALLLGNAAD